jgi:hypothetical protein
MLITFYNKWTATEHLKLMFMERIENIWLANIRFEVLMTLTMKITAMRNKRLEGNESANSINTYRKENCV